MKRLLFTLLCLSLTLAANHAQETKKDAAKPAAAVKEVAVIKTDAGEMVLELWPDLAPKTVENFKKLAGDKFYDGTAFHRIIKGFMVQGGDPNTKDPAKEGQYGQGGPGYTIKAEFNKTSHVRGVLSMARTPDPDSAGSQFFICLAAAPHLDMQYTAFGKIIKGDDVLGKLGDTQTQGSKPVKRQGVISIRVVPADSIK